ncbi:hypothetical protein [uncultured Desulfosarcina sp.]|uniref:hypothetical protein n=1 Tax=uncultured Desulfosarcina sp. TaxID=218289 RepID=UPI0029C7A857|nr:hypothetical protein [uncultured Desulfosarcina sp.]
MDKKQNIGQVINFKKMLFKNFWHSIRNQCLTLRIIVFQQPEKDHYAKKGMQHDRQNFRPA